MELVQQLVSKLGVSEDQAKGGAGMILKFAKDKLGDTDFGKIASAVPGASELLGSAPSGDDASGGAAGLLGGVASALGASSLGGIASLAGGFSKLGLDASAVGKFVPTIVEFAKEKGGPQVEALLAKVLN